MRELSGSSLEWGVVKRRIAGQGEFMMEATGEHKQCPEVPAD